MLILLGGGGLYWGFRGIFLHRAVLYKMYKCTMCNTQSISMHRNNYIYTYLMKNNKTSKTIQISQCNRCKKKTPRRNNCPHKNCTADLKQVFKVFTYKLILNVGLEYIFCKLLFGSFFLPA